MTNEEPSILEAIALAMPAKRYEMNVPQGINIRVPAQVIMKPDFNFLDSLFNSSFKS